MPPLGNFARIESVAAHAFDAEITHWCNIIGTEFDVFKKTTDEYSRTYGVGEGVEGTATLTMIGVLTNYETVPVDDAADGGFQEGFLYTPQFDKLAPGDEIEIKRAHQTGVNKRFTIIAEQQAGQTQRAFRRWQISSVGE